MKKIICTVITLMLIVSLVPVSAFAGTSAVARYENAVEKEAQARETYLEAKGTYEAARKEFDKGSYGFFKWVYENKSGWIAEDAKDAMDLLDKTSFKKYVEVGGEDDATNLDNMKHSIELLPKLQRLRDNDENFNDLPPVTIRNIYMCRAQVDADVSSVLSKHVMGDDTGYYTYENGENLAWGVWDPFGMWYDEEKDYYNKARKYIKETYGYDINVNEDKDAFREEHENDHEAIIDRYGETGHYINIMLGDMGGIDCEDNPLYYYKADRVIFGLACGAGKGDAEFCFCMNCDCFDNYDESMTISGYTELFNEYYDLVSAPEEKKEYQGAKKAYSDAKADVKTAENNLKKALTIKQKVTRKGRKITVKCGGNEYKTAYQISVSRNKKTGVLKNSVTGKKTIKSKARKYIKSRAYVTVNGKNIYGPWTKVRLI